jgi:hypothetical protein
MNQRFRYGDRVGWSTTHGRTTGRVAKRLTHSTYVRGDKVRVKPGHPEYLLTSERTGKKAVHKPTELKKLG